MALNLTMPEQEELKPRITVFGVGGAGGNAVNNMIEKRLEGVEFVVANTDAQALQQSNAQARIQMGVKVTEGLGAGARPTVGAAAAEESIEQIVDHLAGAHMCFITAGMGGGTGTGAAPIIAQAARELGVLTVGVVTKPFQFEGSKRMRQAEDGVENLQKVVDTLIIIPNQNLFRLANEKTTFTEAFSLADDVLYQGVKGVTDLMVRPGLINLDFADVRAVMDEMGKAMMGTGEADGEDRAIQAAEAAIANPLLDEISLNGAKGVLINITGGYDLTLFELDEAANRIRDVVDPDANIIVGSTLDPDMDGRMRVSVVATGIDAAARTEDIPLPRRPMREPLRRAEVQDAPAAAQPAHVQAPAPAQRPAAAAVAREPLVQEPVEEPSLFSGFDPANAGSSVEDLVETARGGADLPPPAYQPAEEPEAESFVAPRPRSPGEPTPETLARLRAAVAKTPARQPVQATMTAAQQDDPRGDKGRFGIGSLINRMSGHAPEQPERSPHTYRQQPPLYSRGPAAYQEEEDLDPDQERIEIPAFLRRQAN
ncbi:cell division protein FtsZ [Rhodovulum sp. BSW8]|uniref:Cell division protein FtsZ n=2 Tax=Rhodovulum visakhapatnamense TaxID=364297 RepID=A0A4R8G1M0_9RHOB|nr:MULTISPECIES: cell division protein FtsZ [Rhodovulum]RBO54850.1 cell division protein FtsZ [Rhodovulum sp. BSW8]TDX33655.1 cell division protein FtsZ [Rhodovulum visakhapatnamense]